MMVATLAGQAAVAITAQFEKWRSAPDPAAVDHLCVAIRDNALSLSVVYFTEWLDRWLMGDQVPGPGVVQGSRFQATCLSPAQAIEYAGQVINQHAEQGWLVSRLREAAAGWGGVAEPYAVIVVREVVGPSADDDEIKAAAESIPAWLPLIERRDELREM
jgi:hypothetical protein